MGAMAFKLLCSFAQVPQGGLLREVGVVCFFRSVWIASGSWVRRFWASLAPSERLVCESLADVRSRRKMTATPTTLRRKHGLTSCSAQPKPAKPGTPKSKTLETRTAEPEADTVESVVNHRKPSGGSKLSKDAALF